MMFLNIIDYMMILQYSFKSMIICFQLISFLPYEDGLHKQNVTPSLLGGVVEIGELLM